MGYFTEPIIDEYGFADYGIGSPAVPTRYVFGEDSPFETIDGGDAQPKYWVEIAEDYWLSNYGELYSCKANKFLKPKPLDREGHLGYCLYINGKRKYVYQHRLIAEAFVAKTNDIFNIVRHLDSCPTCNDISNLEWGTQRENWQDSYELGTVHFVTPEEREMGLEKVRKPTRAINLKTGEVREYHSLLEAVKDLGVQQANAYKVIAGERPHTCGWRFEYMKRGD